MVEGTASYSRVDNYQRLEQSLKELSNIRVYVGIPEEKASREGDNGPNNAELLYIHSKGSELQNIPARPVLEPVIEKNQPQISQLLKKAMKSGLSGDRVKMIAEFHQAGQYAENKAKAYFVDNTNGWPPNSPKTVARKKSNRPLIDTGQLRKSITHVVKVGDSK